MATIPAYLNPDLFTEAAVPTDIRGFNAALIAAMTNLPNWWEVGAPVVRELRVKGGSAFPPPVYSPRARSIEIDGPAGRITLRVIAPVRSRGAYLHIHGGGWVLGAADQQDIMLERLADSTEPDGHRRQVPGSLPSIPIRPARTTARPPRCGSAAPHSVRGQRPRDRR